MRVLLLCLFALGLVTPSLALAEAGPHVSHPDQPRSSPPPIRMLSAGDALADVGLMRRGLEIVHPGLYRRTSKAEIDRRFADLEAGISGTISEAELYRRVSELLAQVRCTHTKADQSEEMEDWRRDNASHLPFRFRIVEGRMLVVSSDPAQTKLPRGAEILKINGRGVGGLIRTLGAYVPIDGRTEASRPVFLSHDGDLMGADFDHFYPYVFGFPGAFELTLRENDLAPVQKVRLAPVSFRTWVKLENDGRPFRQNFDTATQWRMLDGDIGYLRVDTFVNYRTPVDAAALYSRALGELRSAGARKLILDLRNNGGGSNDAALALVDALALEPYTYQRAVRYRAVRYGDLPNFISSWGDRDALFNPPMTRFAETADGQFDLLPAFAADVLTERRPVPDAFTGPVTVLISPANASGATMAVAKLRDMGRIRTVGEPSGGSADGPTAGTIFNLKLPNSGISVRIPLAFNEMAVGKFDRAGGIRPDVRVEPRIADFRAGFDRTLARAISDLKARTPTGAKS